MRYSIDIVKKKLLYNVYIFNQHGKCVMGSTFDTKDEAKPFIERCKKFYKTDRVNDKTLS